MRMRTRTGWACLAALALALSAFGCAGRLTPQTVPQMASHVLQVAQDAYWGVEAAHDVGWLVDETAPDGEVHACFQGAPQNLGCYTLATATLNIVIHAARDAQTDPEAAAVAVLMDVLSQMPANNRVRPYLVAVVRLLTPLNPPASLTPSIAA